MIYYVDIYRSLSLPDISEVDFSKWINDLEYKIIAHIISAPSEELIEWATAEESQKRFLFFRLTEMRYAEFLLTFS